MKQLLTLISAFSLLTATAQDAESYRRFAVGINFSPDYCYRALKYKGSDAMVAYTLKNRNVTEVAKAGFTTGLNFSYFLKQNLTLETGVQYSNKGFKTAWMDVSNGNNINTTTGFSTPDPNDPIMIQFVYNDEYIDVPLKINYLMGKRNLRLIAGAGVAANIFIMEKSYTRKQFMGGRKENGEKTKSINSVNSFNVSALVSVGADINLVKQFNLRIEPAYRYGLLNIRKNSEIKESLWNLGLNLGLYYKF